MAHTIVTCHFCHSLSSPETSCLPVGTSRGRRPIPPKAAAPSLYEGLQQRNQCSSQSEQQSLRGQAGYQDGSKSRYVNPICTPRVDPLNVDPLPRTVLSFMSAFGSPKSPTTTSFSGPQYSPTSQSGQFGSSQDVTTSSSPTHASAPSRDSPPPRTRTERTSSIRPMSMVQTYQPPLMEIAQDTIPELQPIFTFLNSHANKLYQEGYFLKLNDLDIRMIK